MSIVSRLTLPALIGGFVALAASGIFSPPVFADYSQANTVARILLDHNVGLASLPDGDATNVGTLPARYWVWVERCTIVEGNTQWCLVERGENRGWLQASALDIYSQ